MRKKALMMILVAGFFVFATNAFALDPGDTFKFKDIVDPVLSNPWTHSLDNILDFNPDLSDAEPLIIERARLILSLNFTPEFVGGKKPYVFMAYVTLDGLPMSTKIIKYSFKDDDPVTKTWKARITNPFALDEIADKSATILLTVNEGDLKKVNYSTLSGSGVVGAEPISMVLVGAGMVGLPFAGRWSSICGTSEKTHREIVSIKELI